MNTPLYETETTVYLPKAQAQERFDDVVQKRKAAQAGAAANAREILYALARRIEADPNGANPHEQYLFAKHGVDIPRPAAWAGTVRDTLRRALDFIDPCEGSSARHLRREIENVFTRMEW